MGRLDRPRWDKPIRNIKSSPCHPSHGIAGGFLTPFRSESGRQGGCQFTPHPLTLLSAPLPATATAALGSLAGRPPPPRKLPHPCQRQGGSLRFARRFAPLNAYAYALLSSAPPPWLPPHSGALRERPPPPPHAPSFPPKAGRVRSASHVASLLSILPPWRCEGSPP